MMLVAATVSSAAFAAGSAESWRAAAFYLCSRAGTTLLLCIRVTSLLLAYASGQRVIGKHLNRSSKLAPPLVHTSQQLQKT